MYALVLAGGKGERLRPYTADRPKPMVVANSKPILEHHLEWLRSGGVTHVILLCGYAHQVIQDHFGDGKAWGLHIEYSIEESPLGRGGALKRGFQRVPAQERVVVATNGDIITDQPLEPILASHLGSGALATVMLVPFVSPYGIAEVGDDDVIRGFVEKPQLPYWINGGVYMLARECAPYLPDIGDHENTTFPQLAQQGLLRAFKSQLFWKAVDTIKDLEELQRQLART